MRDEGLAFRGESVLLQAAVGFIGDGHFEQTGCEEGENVAFVIEVCVGEADAFQQLGFAFGTLGTEEEDECDLLTFMMLVG